MFSSNNFRHSAENRALECFLDPQSDVVLRGDDEKRAEDDEGEARPVLDQEEVEVAVLGVGQEEVDVVVGDVEEDEAGEQEGGAAGGGGWEAAGGEGEAQEAEQEGEDRPQHRGDVEGEVDRDGVERVAGGRPHRAEAQVRL